MTGTLQMTDGPAGSAEDATSSPALHESANDETYQGITPEVSFKFTRPKLGRVELNTPVLGKRPYVVLEMHEDGLRVFGGGIAGEPPDSVVAEFMLGAGDAIASIGRHLSS